MARTRRVYDIERYIAEKKGKLMQHFKKWEKLTQALT